MLDTRLLAFGITHLTDARYFAAWNADYLCFPVGPEGLSLDYIVAIREWVEGPTCVVEWRRSAGETISPKDLREHRVSHILLKEDLPDDFSSLGIEVIRHLPVAGYQSAEDVTDRLAAHAGPVLLDFAAGGITYTDLAEGSPFTLGELQQAIGDRPVFLHVDLEAEDAPAAAALFHGLALRGSSEEKVGYKSFDDLDDLLEALEG